MPPKKKPAKKASKKAPMKAATKKTSPRKAPAPRVKASRPKPKAKVASSAGPKLDDAATEEEERGTATAVAERAETIISAPPPSDVALGVTKPVPAACPRCGGPVSTDESGRAISRRDERTVICSECGTDEGMIDAGVNKTTTRPMLMDTWPHRP